jgi:hypothetical protein
MYRVDHFLLLGQARNDPPPSCVQFEGSTTMHHVHNTVMRRRQKHSDLAQRRWVRGRTVRGASVVTIMNIWVTKEAWIFFKQLNHC